MSEPTEEMFNIAALWLEGNEGEGDERAACVGVAEWIKRRSFDKMLRKEARKAGVPIANLRRKLEEQTYERR